MIAIELSEKRSAGRKNLQRYRLPNAWRSWWRSARLIRCKNGAARMQKVAQICTIFETTFFPCRPSAGGAWAACTKCTKRGRFSAQARRGSKRAQRGSGRGSYPPPFAACRALMLMVERSGSAREVAPEARWLRLVGGVVYLCFASGRYGRK